MGFEVPCVKPLEKASCCCCNCTLKTGSLVISWLGVIGALIQTVYGVMCLVLFDGKNVPEAYAPIFPPETYRTVMLIYAIAGPLGIIFNGLTVYAVMKETVKLLQVIVIVHLVSLISIPAFGIFFAIIVFPVSAVLAVAYLITFAIVLGLSLWLWMIIYSFYRQVEEQNNPQNGAYPHNAPDVGKLKNPALPL